MRLGGWSPATPNGSALPIKVTLESPYLSLRGGRVVVLSALALAAGCGGSSPDAMESGTEVTIEMPDGSLVTGRVVEPADEEEFYSRVLVGRTEGQVEFWHLTFQEYLAAAKLAVLDDCWDRMVVETSVALV